VKLSIGMKKITTTAALLAAVLFYGCSPSTPQESSAIKGDQRSVESNAVVEDAPSAPLKVPTQDPGPTDPVVEYDVEQVPAAAILELPSPIEADGQPGEGTTNPESEPEVAPQQGIGGAGLGESSPDPSLAIDPSTGSIAPDFTLSTVNGEQVNLHELRGKTILVNYWVTWCIPCIEEMPVLEKLHQEYQDQDFILLSVNGIAQDDMSTVMSTLGDFDVTFPVVLDDNDSVYNEYKVRFMPTSFFIDRQGVIRHIQLGSTTEEGFRNQIDQLLSEQL
jgi:peroxiredoxin